MRLSPFTHALPGTQVWVRVPLICEGRNATTTPCCPWSCCCCSAHHLPSDQSYSFFDLCNLLEDLIAMVRDQSWSEGPLMPALEQMS